MAAIVTTQEEIDPNTGRRGTRRGRGREVLTQAGSFLRGSEIRTEAGQTRMRESLARLADAAARRAAMTLDELADAADEGDVAASTLLQHRSRDLSENDLAAFWAARDARSRSM